MSKVWDSFMQSELAREVVAELEKAKQSKQAQALSPSAETMGVASGGGSLVGSGDSKALYTTKSAPVQGDGTVEGLEDRHKAMLEVAHKEPTGKLASSVKPFAKKAQQMDPAGAAAMKDAFKMMDKEGEEDADGASMMMDKEGDSSMMASCSMHGDECDGNHDDSESLEDLLGEHHDHEAHDHEHEDHDHEAHDHEHEDHDHEDLSLEELLATASSRERKTVALLKELVKIANQLDLEGATEEASEIDAVITAEVQSLKKKIK